MNPTISLDDIIQRINLSLARVKHVTAFVAEDTLKNVIIYIIVSFVGASLTILFMILLRRTILLKQGKRKKKLVEKYSTFLAESITYIYENDKIFEKKVFQTTLNKDDQTKPFNRQILLDQIMLMRRHVGGEEAFTLRHLYEKLGFYKDSLKKTKSLFWHTRLEGLQELILMNATAIETTVKKMILDKNPYIRIDALRALILRNNDWQTPLIRYSYPLSAWEQYQICDALSRVQNINLPDFTPLLKSYNPTVIVFGLRMIKHFHSMAAIPQVVPFLEHNNAEIVKLAESTLEQFGFDKKMIEMGLLDELLMDIQPSLDISNLPNNNDVLLNPDILNTDFFFNLDMPKEGLKKPKHFIHIYEYSFKF